MRKDGPIVIIEDDPEDQDILREALKELDYPNSVIFFGDGDSAFEYLETSTDRPFLILSDINLPKLDGFQLRDKVHNNEQLRLKCIPYIFFTTTVQQQHVIDAYSRSVQGFFTKPSSFKEIVRVMKNIVEYWKDCQSPNVIV